MSTNIQTMNNSIIATNNDMYIIAPTGVFESNIFNSNVLNLYSVNTVTFGNSTGTYIYNDNSIINNYITTGSSGGGGNVSISGTSYTGSVIIGDISSSNLYYSPLLTTSVETSNTGALNVNGYLRVSNLIIPGLIMQETENIDPKFNTNIISSSSGGGGGGGSITSTAATGSLTWLSSGTNDSKGHTITTDSSGNSYVMGTFKNTQTLYNENNSSFKTLTGTSNKNYCYVAKYNSSGVGQWAIQINCPFRYEDYNLTGRSIAVDSTGNVYIVGQGSGTYNIINADGTIFKTNTTATGVIMKFNSSGIGQWLGYLSTGTPWGVAVDAADNVIYTGFFTSSPSNIYNADNSVFQAITSDGSWKGFLIKFNSSGTAQWALTLDTAGQTAYAFTLVTDSSNNIYLNSLFYGGTMTINNADGSVFKSINNSGQYDSSVIKFNSSGIGQWATIISGTSREQSTGIGIDSSNNIYISGLNSSNTLNIFNYNDYSTPWKTFTMPVGISTSRFLVKYNSSGSGVWATVFNLNGGDVSQYNNDLAIDSGNNVLVCGFYDANSIQFFNADTTSFGSLTRGTGNTYNGYIACYNSSGTCIWITKLSNCSTIVANSISVDNSGNLYVCGSYQGSANATLYNSDGTTFKSISNSGASDIYVAKYNYGTVVQGGGGGGGGISTYYLTDLANTASNNGKTITITNIGAISATISLKDTSGTIYATYTTANSAIFLFYNGKWRLVTNS